MHIASVGQQANIAAMQRMPEAKEAPGPDRDGDGDDRGMSAAKSSLAKGVGALLDQLA